MAKGNLFLGVAGGSVGDVTFYRKNGEQISRVRRRSVKNPNTDPQLIQRAVVATVAKAYAAGREIFDHSFEGVATGAACQAKFMKINIDLLRSLVKKDLESNAGENQCKGVVVPRSAVYPVPAPYRVATGSLYQDFFTCVDNDNGPAVVANAPAGQTTKVGEWLAANRIIDDDIFTIVCFGLTSAWTEDDTNRFRTAYACKFAWMRLRVKTEALTSTALVNDALFTDVFEIKSSEGMTMNGHPSDAILMETVMRDFSAGAYGVIRSRENSGLRSNCDLYLSTYGSWNDKMQWGIISKYLTEFWSPFEQVAGQSPLILEGGSITR